MGSGDESELAQLRAQLSTLTGMVAALGKAPACTISIREVYRAYEREMSATKSWRMRKDKLAPLIKLRGDLMAMSLTPKEWARHRAERRATKMDYGRSKGKAPAEATLNVELGVAKGMLEFAASDEQELIPFNPLRRAKRVKTKKARKTWLRDDDLERLLSSPEPRGEEQRRALHAWVLVQADTGLRFSEALAIRRDRLRETVDGWVIDVDRTKGDKEHKSGLTPRTLAALEALPRSLRSPYYFTRPSTQRLYGKRTVYGWFREACRACGLDDIVVDGEIRVRPHDLRRSAATNVVNKGGTIQDAQAMLNHANIATTALYVQRPDTDATTIARIMASAVRRGPRSANTRPDSVSTPNASDG